MVTLLWLLWWALQIFWFLLLARIIVEMIQSFSRDWRPSGVMAVIFEILFTITDPPVKALRRLMPPVRLGAVALDLSVIVLFIGIIVLQQIILRGLIPAVM